MVLLRIRDLDNTLIIIIKYMVLKDGVLEIEKGFKVIIDGNNRKKSLSSLIILLRKDIWRLAQDLNIYHCCHIYIRNRIKHNNVLFS